MLLLSALALCGPPPERSDDPADIVMIEPAQPASRGEASAPEAQTASQPAAQPDARERPPASPAIAPITEPAATEPARTWQAEIFADLFYAVNSNSPDNHVFRGMTTSPRTGEFSPNAVGAFVRHRANEDEPWWFEFGLHAGAAVDALVFADPTPGGVDSHYAGVEVFKHIAVANAGVRIRRSRTSFGAGVFESPFGVASFWTYRNPNYTPTWQNHIGPYYFMGARVAQELGGGVTLLGWVVNGAAGYADANKAPSGIVSLAFAPEARKGMQALSINSSVLFGPEGRSIAPADWLIMWDTTFAWDFDAHFSMAGAWDLTVENPGRDPAQQNLYTGGGVLARGTIFERPHVTMDLVVRPEVLWDRDGRFLGVPQWLFAPTATLNLRVWEHLLFRVEYRFDQSTARDGFFWRGAATNEASPGLARRQHTVFFALAARWDFWFGRREQ